jgi:predicted NUDIX family phosphoesterase
LKSEFLVVAKTLMETEQRPMSAVDLVDIAQDRQLFSDNIAGRTPYQTMKSKLSVHIRRFGKHSPFVRTQPGRFYLSALMDGTVPPFDSKPFSPPQSRENVLVFRREDLDQITTWQGIQPNWRRVSKRIFLSLAPNYMPRFEVEQDNAYTQIVTYVLVCRGASVLAYRRGTYNRVDQYLRGSDCIGFGGHVSEGDLNLFNADTLGVYDSAARELAEELQMPEVDIQRLKNHEGLRMIGIINDDSTDVGRRHLAFVMRYDVSESVYWDNPERGEKGITQLRWVSENSPQTVWLWNFEYWSQLCFREFASGLTLARPAFRLIRRTCLKPPHVLCIIGPVGSGKTLATDVLKEEFGYVEINTGRVMAELLGIPAVPETSRPEFQIKAWRFIQSPDGPRRLAARLVEMVSIADAPRILVDGIRQRVTLDLIRNLLRPRRVGVMFVQTPPDVAYSFYNQRRAQGASISDFLTARSAPVETEVGDLIKSADAVLYNWTGKPDYRRAIRLMMKDLGIEESSNG